MASIKKLRIPDDNQDRSPESQYPQIDLTPMAKDLVSNKKRFSVSSFQSRDELSSEKENPELSLDPKQKRFQIIYLTLNDYESSQLAFFISFFSIAIIATDITFLIIENEPALQMDTDIWVIVNPGISAYFFVEFFLRSISYNAFNETLKEFFQKPHNTLDLITLIYCGFEIIMYNCNVIVDNRVKIFRMLIVLRLVRIFKFSTFQKGMNILLRGLSESFQALSLLLFFTMICVLLIASFMYFAESQLTDTNMITNIPEAIWWAIITITTVGYGDYVPKSGLGKFIGSLSLIFGVLLLSLPVAIIGNKFQEIYLENKKETTRLSRNKTKVQYHTCQNSDEKEIYRIIMKLDELEEVNEKIESYLQQNLFLYRSISRDAENMIKKIELNKDKAKPIKKWDRDVSVIKIKEEIKKNRKPKNI